MSSRASSGSPAYAWFANQPLGQLGHKLGLQGRLDRRCLVSQSAANGSSELKSTLRHSWDVLR